MTREEESARRTQLLEGNVQIAPRGNVLLYLYMTREEESARKTQLLEGNVQIAPRGNVLTTRVDHLQVHA